MIYGVPLIYLGDELGLLNDYEHRRDPAKADDSRWVHRPSMDWQRAAQRTDQSQIAGRIYQQLRRLITLRQQTPALSGHALDILETGNEHVFGDVRRHRDSRVLALANFSERDQTIGANFLRIHALSEALTDLAAGAPVAPHTDFVLAPYQFAWLSS